MVGARTWRIAGVLVLGWVVMGGAACGGTRAASIAPGQAEAHKPAPIRPPDVAVVPGPPTVDPPLEAWPSLVNHRVTFRDGWLESYRSCTKKLCPDDRACCNRCSAGKMLYRVANTTVGLTRANKEPSCSAGMDCEERCELPPGNAIVTGVLTHQDDYWKLDLEQLEHRVGSCTQTAGAVRATELSPTDQCDAKLSCDDGKTLEITCDGENDGTHSSLCTCKAGGQDVPLTNPIRSEAPRSCDYAAAQCLERLANAK